jgi:hypothetical protein
MYFIEERESVCKKNEKTVSKQITMSSRESTVEETIDAALRRATSFF